MLLPHVGKWQLEHADTLTIAVVSRGMAADQGQVYNLKSVILQQDREIAQQYKIRVTPTAVLVWPDGSIASDLAVGPQAIADLLSRTATRQIKSSPEPAGKQVELPSVTALQTAYSSQIGQMAAPVALQGLEGEIIELASFRGRQTVVLLWNPSCGFCQKMLPDLQAWERARTGDAPELFVISMGSSEANKALGLRSRLALDQPLGLGRALGLRGTPSAVLLDSEGKIASPVAGGAKAVFALVDSAAHTRGPTSQNRLMTVAGQ
jgi:protein-disulfide isomerase